MQHHYGSQSSIQVHGKSSNSKECCDMLSPTQLAEGLNDLHAGVGWAFALQLSLFQAEVCSRANNKAARPVTYLIDEVLEMLVCEGLGGPDDLMQICVHQVMHQIHVLEVLLRCWPHDILQPNNVWMLKVPQQLHLSQRLSAVGCMLKSVAELLDGDLLPVPHILG